MISASAFAARPPADSSRLRRLRAPRALRSAAIRPATRRRVPLSPLPSRASRAGRSRVEGIGGAAKRPRRRPAGRRSQCPRRAQPPRGLESAGQPDAESGRVNGARPMTLHLEIVTPERLAYEDDVDMVLVPGAEGELGILPHHTPLVSLLGVGELKIRKGNEEESFAIAGGFLQVRPDKVVVMAETADMASEIDLERAQEARREAERTLESGYVEEADLAAARAQLQTALLRIRVAERRHREGPRRGA